MSSKARAAMAALKRTERDVARLAKVMAALVAMENVGASRSAGARAKAPTKAVRGAKRTTRLAAIGKTFAYLDGKVKVTERRNGKYIVKALTAIHKGEKTLAKKGKAFPVGSVWLYKQMGA